MDDSKLRFWLDLGAQIALFVIWATIFYYLGLINTTGDGDIAIIIFVVAVVLFIGLDVVRSYMVEDDG